MVTILVLVAVVFFVVETYVVELPEPPKAVVVVDAIGVVVEEAVVEDCGTVVDVEIMIAVAVSEACAPLVSTIRSSTV